MVLADCSYMPPFFHISASNTRKLPNGIFEAITSKLSCSRCWSLSSRSLPLPCRLVIQKRQDKPRKTIFFKSVAASAGHGDGQKAANSRTGFKKGTHLQAVILECSVYLPGYCVHEEFRCVKAVRTEDFILLMTACRMASS